MLQQTLIERKQYMQQLRDLQFSEYYHFMLSKSPNLSKQEILANFIYFGSIPEYAKQLTISEKLADLFEQSILKTIDSTPKYLLTTDIDHNPVYDGIRKLNVVDWMLQNG